MFEREIIAIVLVLVVVQVFVPGVDLVAMGTDWLTNQITFW